MWAPALIQDMGLGRAPPAPEDTSARTLLLLGLIAVIKVALGDGVVIGSNYMQIRDCVSVSKHWGLFSSCGTSVIYEPLRAQPVLRCQQFPRAAAGSESRFLTAVGIE